jgi:hypothetical protein
MVCLFVEARLAASPLSVSVRLRSMDQAAPSASVCVLAQIAAALRQCVLNDLYAKKADSLDKARVSSALAVRQW